MLDETQGIEKLTSPEMIKIYAFNFFKLARASTTSFFFSEATSGGGASLLLLVLYGESDLAFPFGSYGIFASGLSVLCLSPFHPILDNKPVLCDQCVPKSSVTSVPYCPLVITQLT